MDTTTMVDTTGDPAAELDLLTADLFDLDVRVAPVAPIVGSNTTSDCTDDTCTRTCPSRGCSATCYCGSRDCNDPRK